jgi:membrane protease subunit HflK
MEEKPNQPESGSVRFKALVNASFLAIGADIFLVLLKYFLSRITGSAVLVADALHSGGDLAITLTVLTSIIVNHSFKKNKWAKHAEGIVALLISFVLIFGGFKVIFNVFVKGGTKYSLTSGIPLVIAFLGISIACAIAIKMSHFKRKIGEKHNSIAFIAEGMHTYSDFFTSLGVWLTLFLGYFSIHIERIMTFIVGVFILRIGINMSVKAISFFNLPELLSSYFKKKLSEETQRNLKRILERFVQVFKRIGSILTQKIFFPDDWFLKNKKKLILSNMLLVIMLYTGTGFYNILPYQTGVKLLFGEVVDINPPGLHFHLPKPFGNVIKVDTQVIARVESGFRTNWNYKGVEPEAYLWEFTHTEGKFLKVPEEAVTLTGDENLIDTNFLCYYRIIDPVKYGFNCENSHEIIRSLFCYEVHTVLAHYNLDVLLTLNRGKVQRELIKNMKKAVQRIPVGVEILNVYMREAHPPIEVVPEYRAVASAREQKNEIIHKANAYANDLLPRSRGKAEVEILESYAFAIEKVDIANGKTQSFLLKNRNFSKYKSVNKVRLWWETVEKVFKDKFIYILPIKTKRRIYSSETKNKIKDVKSEKYENNLGE